MNRIDQLQERVEALAPAMVPYYLERLASLASTRANDDDAWQAFERRLRIAEELSQPRRTTPARRLSGGQH